MPEALTIASGVGALVTNVYKLCFGVYQTIDSIKSAPKHLRTISQDLKVFYSILGNLQGYLDHEDTARGVLHPATSKDLDVVLHGCVTTLQDLHIIVNGFIKKFGTEQSTSKRAGTDDVTKWQSFRSSWKEGEIRTLRTHLANYKITLNIAIAVASLLATLSSPIEFKNLLIVWT